MAPQGPRTDPVDLQLAIDDRVVSDYDTGTTVRHDPRVVAGRLHDLGAEAGLVVLEVDRLGRAEGERPGEGGLAGPHAHDRLSQAVLLQGVKVAVVDQAIS